MNMKDLKVALSFLEPDDSPETMVLQCYKAQDIPYLRRALHELLGYPDSSKDNEYRYGNKRLLLLPLSAGEDKLRGVERIGGNGVRKVFYISYKDGSDWERLKRGEH